MHALPHKTDREILAARGPRAALRPDEARAAFVERERSPGGGIEEITTIIVAGAECSFRCLMCDLWQHTHERGSGTSRVAVQVERALAALPFTPGVKLYNAGSFFDPVAVGAEDRERIARAVEGRDRLIVECHPRLVDEACLEFARAIAPTRLEVAIGLETVDEPLLARLNKHMTLADFARAADRLRAADIDLRCFVLLGLPGHQGAQAVSWTLRSVAHALSSGATCCSVIPVRSGNGMIEVLEREGHYQRPSIAQLEEVLRRSLPPPPSAADGRVFADLWDLAHFATCPDCDPRRIEALETMNRTQQPAAATGCDVCAPRVPRSAGSGAA